MKVGIVYEVAEVICELCNEYFVSVIETDIIEWYDGTKEIKYVEEVECGHCSKMTKVKR